MSFAEKIKRAIGNELTGQYPTVYSLAKQLHISNRTLSRALAKEGTTCKQVIDEHLMALSLAYLNEADTTLESIAYRVGYKTPRSYNASFIRSYGKSPSQYLNQCGDE